MLLEVVLQCIFSTQCSLSTEQCFLIGSVSYSVIALSYSVTKKYWKYSFSVTGKRKSAVQILDGVTLLHKSTYPDSRWIRLE